MHVHVNQEIQYMDNPCFAQRADALNSSTLADAHQASEVPEDRELRAERLYAAPGGPLIGWLFDECRRRGQEYRQMAQCLDVTYGYINQLRNGIRQTRHISDEFAENCARYLGVPPVVVKILAGRMPMSDFVHPQEPEEAALDRAMAQMLDDPVVRQTLPADLRGLSLDAKRALVAMYMDATGRDVLSLHHLPEMVRWVQRAALIHDESLGAAVRGHRDVATIS